MKSSGAVEDLFWLDRSWFAKRVSRQEAEAFCRDLACRHYENFTVISFLLPRRLRQHFSNVYAYCRVSDDLADEAGDAKRSLASLQEWQEHLDRCYAGEASHPVFVALQSTIRQFDIPKDPFADLLKAFRQDQIQTRYRTWEALLGYCRYSANPVGRLVLYLCGHRDERRQRLSDETCTALQLTNFWQDVARDYRRGRIYIPLELMEAHGYSEDLLGRGVFNGAWVSLMKHLVNRTRPLFYSGLKLCSLLRGRVSVDIELFSRGGLEILRAIEASGCDTLHQRPVLTHWKETRLIAGALLRSLNPLRRNPA